MKSQNFGIWILTLIQLYSLNFLGFPLVFMHTNLDWLVELWMPGPDHWFYWFWGHAGLHLYFRIIYQMLSTSKHLFFYMNFIFLLYVYLCMSDKSTLV